VSLPAVLRPRKHARHARPSQAGPALAAAGLTLALGVVDAAALGGAASAASSDANWDRLAACESGGRWSINTGNGYYGGLQFDLATWRSVGMSGYPHQASRETQIVAANRLHDARGFQPWPACSRKLGLTGSAAAAAPAGFSGRTMTVADRRTFRADVRDWQRQMRARGWTITVDGYFGPQSAAVAQRFSREKGLRTAPGTVDAAAFAAAWTAAIT